MTLPSPSSSILKHCYNEPLEVDGKLLAPFIVNGNQNQYNTYGLLEIKNRPTHPQNIIGVYRGDGEVAFSGFGWLEGLSQVKLLLRFQGIGYQPRGKHF